MKRDNKKSSLEINYSKLMKKGFVFLFLSFFLFTSTWAVQVKRILKPALTEIQTKGWHKINTPGDPVIVCLLSSDNVADLGKEVSMASPLDELAIIATTGTVVTVSDGKNAEYFRSPVKTLLKFTVGGAIGKHSVILKDKNGKELGKTSFMVEAKTKISDNSFYEKMFDLFYKGMLVYSPTGYSTHNFEGKDYRFFVTWVLDNNNTNKGMQYFSPYGSDMIDLFAKRQQANGMLWSFIAESDRPGYYETAYGPINCVERFGNTYFVRQPVENHVEYNYIDLFYYAWKANGNDDWMKKMLPAASKAMDYCVTDKLRWSEKFQLLKRPYTIDSWDFQIEDNTTPEIGLNPTMMIDAEKTKFGVFFGDNTGYALACDQLAEMYEYAGDKINAQKYATRSKEIRQKLDAISWNGKFFTHRIEEDPNNTHDLGVDEKSQIAQGNAYSTNRGITHEQSVAIIKTYLNLKNNLPPGSPGEWYAIYPPFQRGWGAHNGIWQYMNGGVAGHAAGELAKGAFENGYESYGADILSRLYDLGMKYGGRIWFAYTGSFPPPPAAPEFSYIDISKQTNMDLIVGNNAKVFNWMDEKEAGNDMINVPTGSQTFNELKFNIIDPAKNNRAAALAVSSRKGYPQSIEVPVNKTGETLYLLHTSSKTGSEKISGSLTMVYDDGSKHYQYIISGKQVDGWWFTDIQKPDAGIAWYGTNQKSKGIGLTWAAIRNPNPTKKIAKIIVHSTTDETIYTIVAMSLSDKPHYVKPKGESFGGPDNWAAALAMSALMEGAAGILDKATKYDIVKLSPKWAASKSDRIQVIARYAASDGYIAYQYAIDRNAKKLMLKVTGSGKKCMVHLLLEEGISSVKSVLIENKAVEFKISRIENSNYLDFDINQAKVQNIEILY